MDAPSVLLARFVSVHSRVSEKLSIGLGVGSVAGGLTQSVTSSSYGVPEWKRKECQPRWFRWHDFSSSALQKAWETGYRKKMTEY